MTQPNPSDAARFAELAKSTRTAMLLTRSKGDLKGRPMTIADVDDDGTVWMATVAEAQVATELKKSSEASLTAQASTLHLYASGTVEVLDDIKLAGKHWSEGLRPWFPDGPETVDLRMIRFTPEEADAWTTSGSDALRFAFDAAKAVIQGKDVRGDEPGAREHLSA